MDDKLGISDTFLHPALWPFFIIKNLRKKYKVIDLDFISTNKKNDLLFILGPGTAINTVTNTEWDIIGKYDSLGLNYFIYHSFVPTYSHIEVGRVPKFRKKLAELIQSKKGDYQDVIRLISKRERRRGLHPRLTPEYFIEGQTVCYYKFPDLVVCPASRPFRQDDFAGKYMYRGSLNLMLYVAFRMKYKRIVLLGCEMNKNVYFFEEMEEAQWLHELCAENAPLIPWLSRSEREKEKYEGMYLTKNKHPYDTVIYAFNDFVLRPNGIELFVARKESVLYPRVPYLDILEFRKST